MKLFLYNFKYPLFCSCLQWWNVLVWIVALCYFHQFRNVSGFLWKILVCRHQNGIFKCCFSMNSLVLFKTKNTWTENILYYSLFFSSKKLCKLILGNVHEGVLLCVKLLCVHTCSWVVDILIKIYCVTRICAYCNEVQGGESLMQTGVIF